MTKGLHLVLVMLLITVPAFAIDPVPPLPDEAEQARYLALTREMRCLKCQGETVADTPAMFAVDIRRQVRTMIAAGRTDQEVKQYLVDRYGEVILLKPRSPWLWIAPAIFLLGGASIAWRIVGQRRRFLASDTSDPDEVETR